MIVIGPKTGVESTTKCLKGWKWWWYRIDLYPKRCM